MIRISIVAAVAVLCSLLFLLPSCSDADARIALTSQSSDDVLILNSELRWETKPSGVQVARLYGDSSNAGAFGLRLRYPSGYRKDPHYHPHDAFVTVLSGSYFRGYGDSFDRAKAIHLVEGTFSVNPAGVSHYEWVEEPAELEIHATGPWGSAYVDAQGNTLKPDGHTHRGDACGGGACVAHRKLGSADRLPIVIKPQDMRWTPRPDGDEVAVLYGDPGKSGPFVIRIRSGSSSRELPHHHPQAASITVLSGEFHLGIGSEFRKLAATKIQAGDILRMRPGLSHFKWNDAPSVVEVQSTGPWQTTWLH